MKGKNSFGLLVAAILAVFIALMPGMAWAQAKGITIIVPYAPGGNTDLNARSIATLVKPYSNEPWIVVSKPGANGNIGQLEVMRAKPDGKTIMLTGGVFILQALKGEVPWKTADDFAHIGIVLASYSGYFVRADAPWKTMTELVEYSKKNPYGVNQGVIGQNGAGTMRYLLLRSTTGIEWTEVPFQGDNPITTAVLGGHVHVGAATMSSLSPQVKAGKVRVLAVASAERLASMPDVPTFKEQGYPLVVPSLNVIMGPKGIPAAPLHSLRKAVEQATASPEYLKFVEDNGGTPYIRIGEKMKPVMDDLTETYRMAIPLMDEHMKKTATK